MDVNTQGEGLTEFGWVAHITTCRFIDQLWRFLCCIVLINEPLLSFPVQRDSSDKVTRGWVCHFGSTVSCRERDRAGDPPRSAHHTHTNYQHHHQLQPGLSQNVPATAAAAAAGPQHRSCMELNRFTAAERCTVTAASKQETVCERLENKSPYNNTDVEGGGQVFIRVIKWKIEVLLLLVNVEK